MRRRKHTCFQPGSRTSVDSRCVNWKSTTGFKAGERRGRGGGKIPGARTGLGARNLDKTSGHYATVKRVGPP